MQRLFAPPARSEQRTITAQSLRRGIPVWAVAVGSAVVGLMAFGLVVALLSRTSPAGVRRRILRRSASASAPPATASAAPTVPAAAPAMHGGPFAAARAAFASVLGAASPGTDQQRRRAAPRCGAGAQRGPLGACFRGPARPADPHDERRRASDRRAHRAAPVPAPAPRPAPPQHAAVDNRGPGAAR